MTSHFSLNKWAATACAVAGTAAMMMNGNCSAESFIAADYATNSTYAGGWNPSADYDPVLTDPGAQNGGYGFGPWTTYDPSPDPIQHALDTTSPNNPFGKAWTLFNPHGTRPNSWPNDDFDASGFFPNSPGTCGNREGTDRSRAGRALPHGLGPDSGMGYHYPGGGLQIGQTFSTVISNPTDRGVYRGYTIVLGNFPENGDHDPDTVVAVGTFEYLTFGRWYTSKTFGTIDCSLFDTDTSPSGMQLDVTVTSTNTYHLAMTPLNHPELAYSEDGPFDNPGPIVWVMYQLYNTDSNFHPPGEYACADRTDFYIKSMTVSGLKLDIQRADSNVVLSWPGYITGFNLESTPSLRPPISWSPVSPNPVVVSNSISDFHNYVTNAIEGTAKFYRLKGSF